jgi:hypothetical protein
VLGVVAVNISTGLSFPFMVIAHGGSALGALRSLAAYWITMFAAGLFVFCALLAIHGLAAQLFSYRLFLRVSSFLQLAAFFAVLGIYFLTPTPTKMNLQTWLPSFWFLGLFQELNGPVDPVFGRLARRAVASLASAIVLALGFYTLAYYRHVRQALEQPDITPGDRPPAEPARPIPSIQVDFEAVGARDISFCSANGCAQPPASPPAGGVWRNRICDRARVHQEHCPRGLEPAERSIAHGKLGSAVLLPCGRASYIQSAVCVAR